MSSTWQSFKDSVSQSLQMTPISPPSSTKKVHFEAAGRSSSATQDTVQKGLGLSIDESNLSSTIVKSQYKGILITTKLNPPFDQFLLAIDPSSVFFAVMALLLVWATVGTIYGTTDTGKLLFRMLVLYKTMAQTFSCFESK